MGKDGFVMAPGAVEPALVPKKKLYTGAEVPCVGLGTFASENYTGDVVAEAVEGALRAGYRFLDCAACYGNEAEIGAVLRKVQDEGLAREELFVLSKVWNDMHAPADVRAACEKTLADLQLSYLDCYLVHWPFPNYHAPGCDGDARNPSSRPYIHSEFMETWRAMEALVDEGLVRHIGVSNVTIPKLELILRDARIKPAVNEMELHPCFSQGELYQFCVDHGILPVGYSPMGSPGRPERDRSPGDVADMEHPAVRAVADARGIHPALVCIKWAVARGQVPIPFSVKREKYLANLRCAVEDPLTPAEIETLRGAECNNRLVKAQVFLWEGAADWMDLWDVDGTIPGWEGYGSH